MRRFIDENSILSLVKRKFLIYHKAVRTRLNIFLVLLLLGAAISFLYFFYYRQRRQLPVYVGVSLLRPLNLPINAPFNWVPYYIGEAIKIGDKEINPLGGVSMVVVEKETYESLTYGQNIYLLLQVKATKDRSGTLLFKNKPLSAGNTIDLRLTGASVQALVTYVGDTPPNYSTYTITLKLKGRELEPGITENLEVGDTLKDDKDRVIAKVIDKKVTPAEIRVNTLGGQAVLFYDQRKRDLETTVEVVAKKISDIYYFAQVQKLKPNEFLFLPLNQVTLNYQITDILNIEPLNP